MSYSATLVGKKYGFENPFKPDPLAVKALRFLTGGKRLLDAGCGEGADMCSLPGEGFRSQL